ncbi:hybrid sensor histidine kinase/response regulator [Geomonas azotofigens]|uniref:hybrid sensor histidine kinase/response regulator n=1 Tax=Geomonas azotofigens TaxID=2843196 RepID=UPI001C10C3DF|nr:PAS domain-containing hybrid sensor histidine kinase/response regulator [Geomonas azotofigens]MBU5613450.1 PAS domain-containing protein [Geomonas azotofigens]
MTDSLNPSEELYRFIIDTIPQIVWTATPDGAQDFANLRWYEFNGLIPGEPDPEPWRSILHPDDVEITARKWKHSLETGEPYSCLHRNRRFDGQYRWVLSRAVAQKDADGRIVRWIGSGTDITEQKVAEAELIRYRDHLEDLVRERTEELVAAKERAEVATRAVLEANDQLEMRVEARTAELRRTERELRQAQKMEAIGTLAAGIAHDFNNILTSILGFTDMVLHKVPEGGTGRAEMQQVFIAAQRAADLVRQILSFSRHSEQERKPVHFSGVIDDAFRLLRPSLPTSIAMVKDVDVPSDADKVLADPTQLHQVLMNLCTNAAHAMLPEGGTLTVSLHAVPAGSPLLAPYPFLAPVDHLHLLVRDTGRGMESRILERIFDPYFTTKPAGEGTGLGLAVVQGIVKNHGGVIVVHSEPGGGTCFEVFLPAVSLEIQREEELPEQLLQGSERILFVDDEESLTVLGQGILENLGYSVVIASNSVAALDLFRADPSGFDLVITDLTMPGLSGKALAREITTLRPDIPIILCTGYKETVDERDAEYGIRACLMKPYTSRTLGRTIRQVLDQKSDSREP